MLNFVFGVHIVIRPVQGQKGVMTMSTSITSNSITDGQKKQVKRFVEDAVDRVFNDGVLDKDSAQRLITNGGELQARVISAILELSNPNEFADEEVESAYDYPHEYKGPKPIEVQIKAIAEIFGLDPTSAFEYAKHLLPLESFVPADALAYTDYFAILYEQRGFAQKHFPEVTDPAEKYCRALQIVHQKIAQSRSFTNWRDGQIDTAHIKVSLRTQEMTQKIAETQKGDILIIAAQLGKRHGGRSVRRAREVFAVKEYGLTSVAGGSIVLVHPERLVRCEELDMDMAGDEFSVGGDGQFGRAPFFHFLDEARFGSRVVSFPSGVYGSASGFVSQ